MIRRFLDISTAHLSPAARDILKIAASEDLAQLKDSIAAGIFDVRPPTERVAPEHPARCLICIPGHYGWFLYVGTDRDDMRQSNMPEELIHRMDYALSKNCDYIMFDCDSQILTELPTWSW